MAVVAAELVVAINVLGELETSFVNVLAVPLTVIVWPFVAVFVIVTVAVIRSAPREVASVKSRAKSMRFMLADGFGVEGVVVTPIEVPFFAAVRTGQDYSVTRGAFLQNVSSEGLEAPQGGICRRAHQGA